MIYTDDEFYRIVSEAVEDRLAVYAALAAVRDGTYLWALDGTCPAGAD